MYIYQREGTKTRTDKKTKKLFNWQKQLGECEEKKWEKMY